MACSCTCCPWKRKRSGKYHEDAREPVEGCPFCAISDGAEQHRVLFQNERLVVIRNIRPQALEHLLVIPRVHLANTDCMRPQDLELAEEMERVGREVLGRHAPPGSSRTKFGYHVPPWRSVDHLHLHCMALPHVPFWSALKYWQPGVWLGSEALIGRLKRQGGVLGGQAM
ncbi:hypothetical protein Agub_g4691 [Astrephomene gubernaculifera]|uniref:HIT domain-containing protein n=1 Tax=Astrephomene gubernaculifera TaxID=47775 RepID=A0AAD3HJG1_9CHLO|nr:hypothetical protein Agub_g4691 [Astrephomene gubernaculifera]